MGMRFFGGGVGHKSTRAATDHFLDDRDHSDISIDGEHDTIDSDNLMDCEDEVADSPIAEGSVLDGDDDYGYGDPLEELEDIVSDDPEDDGNSKEDGAVEGGS
jgi:hypothetical protein